MEWKPLRWAWGLVPIAMLSWLVVLTEREHVETDLRTRAQAALASGGLAWAGSTFNGRDAILTGQASEDNEPDQAIQLLTQTWGVRVIDNRAELIEKADVYHWSATEKDNKLRLAGYVPNDATRKAILALAKSSFPRFTVEDAMKLARGAPPRDTWMGAVEFALKTLTHVKNGVAELEGTSLSLAGSANDPASYKAAKAALSGSLPRSVKLKTDGVKLPLVNPYTWSVQLQQGQAVLSGHVPSEQGRTQLANVAKAAFGSRPVTDRTELADGAPDGFVPAATEAIRELAKLEDGHAELRGAQMNFAGMAATDQVAEGVRKTLKEKLPASIKATDAIKFKAASVPTVDQYRTSVDATSLAVVLTGFAPSDAAKSLLAETVKARLPNRKIDNRIVVANGAPAGWQSCMQYGLAGLGRVGSGKIEMMRAKLALRAETGDEELQKALPGELGLAVGNVCELDAQIKLTSAEVAAKKQDRDRCQDQLVGVVTAGVILFERASAELSSASNATLDEIGRALKACPDGVIEIEGHTDSDGDGGANQRLSEKRADSVRQYLTGAGIGADRLTTVGYGADKPVAPNDTAENMARNRRIEFNVKSR